jgi:hypothetical protein
MSISEIKARLGKADYSSEEMRKDIFFLMTYADRCDRILAKAVSDPGSQAKVSNATLEISCCDS